MKKILDKIDKYSELISSICIGILTLYMTLKGEYVAMMLGFVCLRLVSIEGYFKEVSSVFTDAIVTYEKNELED